MVNKALSYRYLTPKYLTNNPNRFAYSKCPQMERVLDTRAMNSYVTKCQEAGVGPAGILTKIDRLVTALDFVLLQKSSANDAERVAEVETARRRMTAWRASLRKDKKRTTALQLDRERQEVYDLSQLTEITRHPGLFSDFDRLRSKSELSQQDMKLLTAMASAMLLYSSAQRPGAVLNCTLAEYEARKFEGDITVITVAEHKTSSCGPARLTLGRKAALLVEAYVEDIRPQIGQGKKLLLLQTDTGAAKAVQRIDPLLAMLEKTYGVQVPPATTVRKAVSTIGAQKLSDPEVRLLSKQLSHSVQTHKKHYEQLDTVAGAAQTHRIVQGLAGPSAKVKQQRKQYTETEIIEITTGFARAIATQRSISLAEAREFLNHNKKVKRSPKQVQDKVAAIIKRNKEDGYGPAKVD